MRDSSDSATSASQGEHVLDAKDLLGLASDSISHFSKGFASHDVTQREDGHFVVDDAHLLFSGSFSKSGSDLKLSGDGREITLHDYFKGEAQAPIYAPDGSSLSGQVVSALAGHSDFAQAGDPQPAADTAIGQVAKLAGTASVIRNGVAVELHIGDKVFKGDVVEAGADTALGITFVDGTAFSLGSNARMVLNEMVYDPNGSSNSSFLSLVQGTITFVAGQTAKNGTMKIDTPVATMGIRGTAVFVDISANDGPTKFSVLVEPGNHVGSYDLYNKVTGDKIGEVSTAGIQVIVTPTGFNQLSISEQPKTLLDLQAEQALIQQLFSMAFQKVNDADPKFNFGAIGSGVSPFGSEVFYAFAPQSPSEIKLASLGGDSTSNTTPTLNLSIIPLIPLNPLNPPPIVEVTNVSTAQSGGVTPVFVTQSPTPGINDFLIANQVTIIDPSVGVPPFFDIAVKYVPGTAVLVSAVGPSTLSTPSATALPTNFLSSLISIDPATGKVTYDPSKFQFLGQGETAVYTISFDSYGGPPGQNESNSPPYTVQETLTFTVVGLNDPPVFSATGTYQYSTSSTGSASLVTVNAGTTAGSVPEVSAALTERPGQSGSTALDTATIVLPFTDQDFSDVAKNYSVKLTNVSASWTPVAGSTPDAALTAAENAATLAAENSASLTFEGLTKYLNSINGQVTELFSAPDKAFDYLAAGETLTLSYTIQVTDPEGATGTEVLNIVVTGTNDVPVIQSSAPLQAPFTLGNGAGKSWVVAGSTYTFTDPDLSDTHTPSAVFEQATLDGADGKPIGTLGQIGTIATDLIKDSTGGVVGSFGWTLTLTAADLAFIYNTKDVPSGDTVVETFDISINDPYGGTATEVVTVDIPTVDKWTGATRDGLWSDPGNWTAGVPGSISNVDIAPATGTIVTISADDTVFGLNTNCHATLDITAGTLTITGPISNAIAGPVNNAGTIVDASNLEINGATLANTTSGATLSVEAGDTLALENGAVIKGGNLANAGTVRVETSAGATLDGVAVSGGGTIQVDTDDSCSTLVLKDGTSVTSGTLSLGNAGKVEVETAAGASLIDVTVLNGTCDTPSGLIQVDCGSILTLDGSSVTGGTITDNGTIAIDGLTTLTLSNVTIDGGTINDGTAGDGGTIEIAGSSTFENVTLNNGHLTVDACEILTLDNLTVAGTTVTNDGTIDVHSGSVKFGAAVSGTGTIAVATGTSVEFGDSVASGQTISFVGAAGTVAKIVLDQAQNFHGTISGFAGTGAETASDQIDLANINFDSACFHESFCATTDVLTVTDGMHTASIQFTGSYVAANFSFAADGNLIGGASGTSGTLIYDPPATPSQTGHGSAAMVTASNDVFVFGSGSGQQTLTDFHPGLDKIELDYFNPVSSTGQPETFDQWAAAGGLVHQGASTLVVLDPGHPTHTDTLLLKNVASLSANDFIIHPGGHAA